MDLILNLKEKWFDMWKSGEKPEDYRKMTKYWAKRLCDNYDRFCTTVFDSQIKTPCFYRDICPHFRPKKFDGLVLKSGYPKGGDKDRNLRFDGSPEIEIGKGKEEWGAIPNEISFIIKKAKIMENKDYKLIPFDIQRAKTPENPSGLEVVTESGKDVRIICTDRSSRGYPIVALIQNGSRFKETHSCDEEGVTFDESECLFLKEPVTQRKMTRQELAWWLRDAPEEHREYVYFSTNDKYEERRLIHCAYTYSQGMKDKPVDGILIRSNGGEWHEPFIEEEDGTWKIQY